MSEACARSDIGLVRSRNEDSFLVDQEIGLFLLADGMGGARGGARASSLAVEAAAATLRSLEHRDPAALLEAFENANDAVMREAKADPRLEGMGTTMVAALRLEQAYAIASVGDSRAYLLSADGFDLITEDQSWVQQVGKPLGLDDAALSRHPMRHVLTMALGVSDNLDVRYYKVNAPRGSLLLMSSDGLHGVVPKERIEAILREDADGNNTLQEKCYSLIRAAREAGGPDNITAILVRAD